METSDKNQKELLKNNRKISSSGKPKATRGTAQPHAPSPKRKTSKASQSQEYRRKKPDALEGKGAGKYNSQESNIKGRGRAASDKARSGGNGPQNRDVLQVQSVQFSSGGGVAGGGGGNFASSLTSLLGLFASSATLAKGEGGAILASSNQSTNLLLRSSFNLSSNQTSNFLSEDSKGLKTVLGITTDQNADASTGLKFNNDIGTTQAAYRLENLQDPFTTLLRNIGTQATDTAADQSSTTPLTLIQTIGFSYYQELINGNTTYFNNSVRFTFPNTDVPYSSIISSYFTNLGEPTASQYTYQVVSPAYLPQTATYAEGITVNSASSADPLSVNVTIPNFTPASTTTGFTTTATGLTLDAQGNVYANVSAPLSVLLNVTETTSTGTLLTLPVRIDAGPGDAISSEGTGLVIGDKSASNALVSSVITSDYSNTIVGNAYNLNFMNIGTGAALLNYQSLFTNYGNIPQYLLNLEGGGANFLTSFTPTVSSTYTIPGNVIFDHSLTGTNSTPANVAYGNFMTGSIDDSFENPFVPLPYNIQMGGNVLDVFGTKYGTGQSLSVTLQGSSLTSYTNDVSLGGNTLAGFGTAYGDLQDLTIQPTVQTSVPPFATSMPATDITFNSNLLYVDKSVGSTLYPYIQNLDLLNTTANGTVASPTNITLVFNDSVIHGNNGNDTFYGDIQNLGDLGNSDLYNGFITGVTENSNNPLDVTITDGNNNSITFGNNIYTGDNADSTTGKIIGADTYNFTLVGTTTAKPVMLGNDLITDFNPSTDTLNFQITPQLFKALDFSHDKVVTAADLDEALTFGAPGSLETTLFAQYLTGANNTTIDFSGGGSLTLEGISLAKYPDLASFPNVTIDVGLTYQAVTNLAVAPTQPLLYGEGPNNVVGPYYNELDNFFNNSLFATYAVSPPAGVNIDSYGTITVTTTTPWIVPLTITASATDQQHNNPSSATTTLDFGFLDAPLETSSQGTLAGAYSSNILEGTQSSGQTLIGNGAYTPAPTLIGGGADTGDNTSTTDGANLTIQAVAGTTAPSTSSSYGSNLIVAVNINPLSSTDAGATAYGDFENITINTQATASLTYTDTTPPQGFESITGDVLTFNQNAFDVIGTTYGVADTMTLNVDGGGNTTVNYANLATLAAVNNSGDYENNQVTFGAQAVYGYGTVYGQLDNLDINLASGSLTNLDISSATGNLTTATLPIAGDINISANVTGNTFTFGSTNITIQDPSDGSQTSTIYGNLNSLDITAASAYQKIPTPPLTLEQSAVFSGNSFVFGNDTLTGGSGNTIFYGHIQYLGDPGAYENAQGLVNYNGFVDGVTVQNTQGTGLLPTLTITDDNGNSITWGNDTYTGGQGSNAFNFTIVEDTVGYGVMQGYDTITNFNLSTDTLVLNFESNLYYKLAGAGNTLTAQALASDGIITFFPYLSGTEIEFTGAGTAPNGGIILGNISFDDLFIPDLLNTLFSDIVINSVGTSYTSFIVNQTAPFDPVFASLAANGTSSAIALVQPAAFASFISNANPTALTYSATGFDPNLGISLSSDGTLTVNVNGPVTEVVNIAVTDGTTTTNLPTLQLFALNTTDGTINRDTSALVEGNLTTQAFETATPGNTIYGGGAAIQEVAGQAAQTLTYGSKLIYDISSGGHTAVGDVPDIQFTDNGGVLTGQTLTFGANLFNVNAGAGGGIYGNAQDVTLSASGGQTTTSNPVTVTPLNGVISDNQFNFGANTLYGEGTLYGDMQNLTFTLTNPVAGTQGSVGNASITGNTFTFGGNTLNGNMLYGDTAPTTLYAGIGTFSMVNGQTASSSFTPTGASSITSNQLVFGNSTLVAGAGPTTFYGDIADLSNTDFATQSVYLASTPNGAEAITDSQTSGNEITWGNDTFTGNSSSTGNTYNFVLFNLNAPTTTAVMEGNATLTNFNLSTDTLNLDLTSSLFKALDTTYDRVVSVSELSAILPITNAITSTNESTTINFYEGAGVNGGSIRFDNLYFTSLSSITNLNITIDYTPAAIGINGTIPVLPVLFNSAHGLYGNFPDQYFTNINVGNVNSTYTVSSAINGIALPPGLAFNADDPASTSFGFNEFGTFNATSDADPLLSYVNITPNNVYNLATPPTISLYVGVFNGNTSLQDPNTASGGTFSANSSATGNLLEGQFSNETMTGDGASLNITNPESNLSFGENMLVNTNAGNSAYGDFSTIAFNIQGTNSYEFAFNSTAVTDTTYNFGSNAFLVTGSVYGIADTLDINVNGAYSLPGPYDFVVEGTDSATFASNQIIFGAQTIYGDGTVYGDLNNLNINLTAANVSVLGNNGETDATFANNLFTFGPNQIVISGTDASTVFTDIDNLNVTYSSITYTSYAGAITYQDNQFVFSDNTTVVNGTGAVDIYPDINNLAATLFDQSPVTAAAATPAATTVDPDPASVITVTDSSGNSITWGNDTIYLGTGTAQNTIHLNVFETTTNTLVLQGNTTLYNFNPNIDKIELTLSAPLYASLDTAFNRTVTYQELMNRIPALAIDSSGNTVLEFGTAGDNGSITFENNELADLSINITFNLAYTPGPVTIAANVPAQPIILANSAGLLGNYLDQFFSNVDIASTSATYTVTSAITGIALPTLFAFNASDASSTQEGFNQYGTLNLAANPDNPVLSYINVMPYEPGSASPVTLPLLIGAFTGAVVTDPLTGTYSGSSSASGGELLQGQNSNETMTGNGTNLTINSTALYPVGTGLAGEYGLTEFGGNMLVNTGTGNTAYGDFQSITLDVQGTNVGANNFVYGSLEQYTYNFGNNAIDVNGTVYGIGGTLTLNIDGTYGLPAPVGNTINATGTDNATFYDNTLNFGAQTLFAPTTVQGTVYGDFNDLNINLTSSNALFQGSYNGSSATFANNILDFGPNQIVITGSGASSIYTDINELNVTYVPILTGDNDSAIYYTGNQFNFSDNITVVNSTGAVDIYPDINNLSTTSFDTGVVTAGIASGNQVMITDGNSNSITWGNDTIYLGTGTAQNTVHLNVFESTSNTLVLQGNITLYNFNPSYDQIDFTLSQPAYQALDTTFSRNATVAELIAALPALSVSSDGTSTIMDFSSGGTTGSITFDNYIFPDMATLENDLNISLAYTSAALTVKTPVSTQPFIFNSAHGVYGNFLDQFFNNINYADPDTSGFFSNNYGLESALPGIATQPEFTPSGGFNQYGSFTATSSTAPVLSYVYVLPFLSNNTNGVSVDLLLGQFNGATATEPTSGPFEGSATMTAGQLYQGTMSGETMAGNGASLSIDGLTAYSSSQDVYGGNVFGNNMLINTNAGTIAYGDFQAINFAVTPTAVTTPATVMDNTYNFGINAFDVNGTVDGIADTLAFSINGLPNLLTYTPSDNSLFSGNTLDFGAQTIYGSGTLYGDMNNLNITLANATFNSNVFGFSSNQIVNLTNNPAIIYTDINSLQVTYSTTTDGQYSATFDNFNNNQFNFSDNTVVINGTGVTDIYPDINNLAGTSFDQSLVMATETGGDVTIQDSNSNSITWGNDSIYLGTGQSSIHLNLFENTSMGLALQGNETIYNFTAGDIINLNLSQPLYNALISSGSPFTGATLDNYTDSSGANAVSIAYVSNNSVISFGDFGSSAQAYGSITLENADYPTLASLGSQLELGANFQGTSGVDNFNFTIPVDSGNDFTSFTQFDTIYNFTPAQDILQFTMSPTLYNSISQDGTLSGSALASAFQTAANITASYENGNTAFDFGTSQASITLDGVDVSSLASLGSNLELGINYQGTSGFDIFEFAIPANANNDFTSFTQFDTVSGFNPGTDILQFTMSQTLYNSISDNGTLSGIALATAFQTAAGITLDYANGNTTLDFANSEASIVFEGVDVTSSTFDSSLELGYTVQPTSTDPTVNFTIPQNANNDFTSFTQFDHIIDFNTAQDTLEFTLSNALYNQISNNGTLTGNQLTEAFQSNANIQVAELPSQTTSTAPNAVNIDSIIEFFQGGTQPFATITLHNVNLGGQLDSLGNHIVITHT